MYFRAFLKEMCKVRDFESISINTIKSCIHECVIMECRKCCFHSFKAFPSMEHSDTLQQCNSISHEVTLC